MRAVPRREMMKLIKLVLPANRQGITIDAVSILLNLFLLPVLTSRVGNLFDQSFRDDAGAVSTLTVLMSLILCGRLAGLYLKRFPLQARLTGAPRTYFPLYFFVLNVPVFIMTAAFASILFTNLLADAGALERSYNGMPKVPQGVAVAVTLASALLMGLEIFLLYRLSKPLSEEERTAAEGDWRFGLKGELLADFGLFAYMLVWQVFHNQTVAVLLTPPPGAPDYFSFKVLSLLFAAFSFMLFYLSPRTVFLVEDRRYFATWLFILLVFLSSVFRYL